MPIFSRKQVPAATLAAPDLSASSEAALDGDNRDEWAQLDQSQDWRQDGPFDITEVDLEADDIDRVDLGALIVTREPSQKIQLSVDPVTKTAANCSIFAAPDAVLEVEVLAAPGSAGFAAEVRQRLTEETVAAGGQVDCVAGPFGTELRRLLVVTGPDGKAVRAPLRDWLVEGPRWLVHAQLLGRAATDTKAAGPAAELEETFRNLVVRRGETAFVPGTAVPLHAPGA